MTPREIVKGLPRKARERLKRYQCWMCETRLDRGWCGACMGPECERDVMLKRMAACLAASRLSEVRSVAAALREAETP